MCLTLEERQPDRPVFDVDRIVFNETLGRMWAGYSGIALLGQSFLESVDDLRRNGNLALIIEAASQTQVAIAIARQARDERTFDQMTSVVSREYFIAHMPDGIGPDQIRFVLENIDMVTDAAPRSRSKLPNDDSGNE